MADLDERAVAALEAIAAEQKRANERQPPRRETFDEKLGRFLANFRWQ